MVKTMISEKGLNLNDKENKKQGPKESGLKSPIRGACRLMPYRGINKHNKAVLSPCFLVDEYKILRYL
jgi:hypothetical protein